VAIRFAANALLWQFSLMERFVGNLKEFFEDGVFEWSEQYGRVVKIKQGFGVCFLYRLWYFRLTDFNGKQNALLISDPKAIHHISNAAGEGYFPRHREHNAIMRLLFGENLVWANDEVHRRHRRIMNPGYTVPTTREFVPLMASTAAHLVEKWHEIVRQSKNGEKEGVEIDVFSWLSKAALDFMGTSTSCSRWQGTNQTLL
jgi:cytochrome P450